MHLVTERLISVINLPFFHSQSFYVSLCAYVCVFLPSMESLHYILFPLHLSLSFALTAAIAEKIKLNLVFHICGTEHRKTKKKIIIIFFFMNKRSYALNECISYGLTRFRIQRTSHHTIECDLSLENINKRNVIWLHWIVICVQYEYGCIIWPEYVCERASEVVRVHPLNVWLKRAAHTHTWVLVTLGLEHSISFGFVLCIVRVYVSKGELSSFVYQIHVLYVNLCHGKSKVANICDYKQVDSINS